MQRVAIVGVSLGLPFVLTGCGNSNSNVNECDPITQSATNPTTGEEHNATITVNLHGGGTSACCQYFADFIGGSTPSTVPDGCDHVSHVSLTQQVENADCSSNECFLQEVGSVTESMAGISEECCGVIQSAVRTHTHVTGQCNVNTFCLLIDIQQPQSATSSLAASPKQLHMATPSMMYAELSKYRTILGVYDSMANVSGAPIASDAIV